MNLNDIILSSALNSFILILIEGIIFFTLLNTVFNNLFQIIISSVLKEINKFINLSYNIFIPLINNSVGIDVSTESPTFQSLAIKLYSVGTMYNQIIEEKQLINTNNIISYLIYTAYIVGFIILIFIILYINNNILKNTTNVSSISYNLIISLILFIIFIVSVSFIIFINISDNININEVEIKFIKMIQTLFT